MSKVYKSIRAQVGMQSLIGVRGTAPHSWGNYFSFASGERCVNMWAENLNAAKEKFLPDDGVIWGWEYTTMQKCYGDGLHECKWFVVDDPRIPQEYLYNKFCFTGCYPPRDKRILKDMFSVHGSDLNQYYHMIENDTTFYI